MLIQAMIYSILGMVTLVAVAEAVRTCFRDEDAKKAARIWSAPVEAIKNKIKGMKTLEEETPAPAPAQQASAVETV